ncbi:ABC transporter permease [Pseudodesulfovibrio piezophilus]|uniref:Binding-protein-dependent transport systems inner membrane component n=1 Tax=Pseudodesulfovibrio piezophilus (strain DSM 21447 / JCM 15486 / C1TLV30) TaxID=1322246 RepID=M1WLL8_PSEP2|nr:ABC transporter permease subunit [Pseudodesulfovibrio piezophilus]CCH48085.1 Binding-protein-dependent transport systems inner membrane component [Pseudodesulfovibrio piezophilus C1TLV30]
MVIWFRSLLHYGFVVVVLLGLWKLAAIALGGIILPHPEEALRLFFFATTTKLFWEHFLVSGYRAVSAMALAWCIAFPLGLVMGSVKKIDQLFAPFIFLTYPVPKIVLLPVFLLLFGLGDLSKIAMIALILGYQILVTTRDGVKSIHPKYYDSVRSLGGSGIDILREVLLPAALPHGFTALRLGTGVSVAVLFFVESFATSRGLGYMIMDAWGAMDYLTMFTGIIGMSLMGAALYELANLMERKLCKWMFLRTKG